MLSSARRRLPYLGALACVLLSSAGCEFRISGGYTFDFKGEKASRTEDGVIDPAIESVEITNRFGDVEVVATEGEAGWNWEGSCWANTRERADELLAGLKMEVRTEGTVQRWEVVLPEQGSTGLRGVKSNLTLRVPAQLDVRLGNEHGDTVCRDLAGSLDLGNAHGEVTISGAGGETSVVNRHGDTVIDHVAGVLKSDTAHGDIDLNEVSSPVEIRSQFGEVELKGATGDVDCRNEHGNTRIEAAGQRIKCESSFGDVEIASGNAAFQLIEVTNQHGDIALQVPAESQSRVAMEIQHGEASSALESASGATAEIRLINQFGDITISKK